MEYQIGDFSKIAQLSIKTLRFYHECGLLAPSRVDPESGYRFYDEDTLQRVRIITQLKEMEFSLKEIKDIVDKYTDDAELRPLVLQKAREVEEKMAEYRRIKHKLDEFIEKEEEWQMDTKIQEIIVKTIPDMLVVAYRFKGKYSDVGKAFGKLFRAGGSQCAGKPFSLYYDAEFREEDADIEACILVKKEVVGGEVTCRVVKGGEALTIIHQGSYETIGNSYKVLFDHMNKHGMKTQLPSREIYLKGPGMILAGNPKRYLTEIQMIVE